MNTKYERMQNRRKLAVGNVHKADTDENTHPNAYDRAIAQMEMCKGCSNQRQLDCHFDLAIRALREMQEREEAVEQGLLITFPSIKNDIDAPLKEKMSDLLEPLKLNAALNSERMKLELRKEARPDDVSILDYTVIAALLYVLADKDCADDETEGDES